MQRVEKTIGSLFREVASAYSSREALIHVSSGLRYNYGLLDWEADRAAKGLIRLGIQPGDRVALWAPNVAEWIVAMLALARMGALMVPIDPEAEPADVQYILSQSEARALIACKEADLEDYIDTMLEMRDSVPSLEHIILIADESFPETELWTEVLAGGEDVPPEVLLDISFGQQPSDPVAVMYTSGTTGSPKGVVLDHAGLINKSFHSTARQGITAEDRLCLYFPLFHMFGNTCVALAGLIRGACIVMPCLSFDASAILKALKEEQCTAVYGSPSMFMGLVEHPENQTKLWGTVLKGIVGGAPCPMELMQRLVEEIGVARITVAYGITEASSWITMTDPDDPLDLRVGTIGRPLPCNEVKIVDSASGEEVPPGDRGELCTRGFLMKEYYKMPAATAAAVDQDGWLHTGDIARMDAKGYVTISGRVKDTIFRNGVEIHPVEVEEVLYKRPEVLEAQVFGFVHPEKGDEVAAWVRLKEGAVLSTLTLAAHAKDNVQDECLPHFFKIVDRFPTTRSGKVQKYKLAEMARVEYGGGL